MTAPPKNNIAFAANWSAEILSTPPLIAPARSYIYPLQIAGEEDALARGALRALIRPANAAPFLATFALGFAHPESLNGIWSCPNPAELCAVAGGYAYILNSAAPDQFTLLEMRPVVEIRALPAHQLLLFAGFYSLIAWSANGLAWQSARLTSEGIRLADTGVVAASHTLHGWGWDLRTDQEVPFAIDLRTGKHTGGVA
jgi:hypothetical protein